MAGMHRILPRSPFHAPVAAANVLLRWLALCVVICLLGAVGFYLLAQLSNNVSQYRRDMNATAYRAQLYFDQREALLNFLADLVVASPTVSQSADEDSAYDADVRRLPLGTGRDGLQFSLLLPARAERTLGDLHARLVLVSDDPRAPLKWLHGKPSGASLPPAGLTAALLRNHAAAATAGTEVYWLASGAPQRTVYLYRAAEEGPQPMLWLVLVLDAQAMAQITAGTDPADVLLADPDGRPVLFNRPGVGLPAAWLHAQHDDSFGFVGTARLPLGLALVKSIGQDGWHLVCHLPLRTILRDLVAQILASTLCCLAAMAALWVVVRRLDSQLIQPAQQQHQQLLESFDFGSTVIEMAPVGICVLRLRDGAVLVENQLARDWLGPDTRGGDWIGQWRRAATHGYVSGRAAQGLELKTRTGRQLQVSHAATRYDGNDVLLCVFSDVSRHRQIQEALSAAKQAAEDANQAKSAFVATMSHEIRTPLYGLLGTLELLGRTLLDARQAQYLKTIQQSSSVLLQLISDVLDVSKIESGQLTLVVKPFSPVALGETIVQGYAAAAARKNLQILVCTDPRLPALVTGDADRIRQVLGNLLSNAIKFTDAGRIVLRVKLISREPGLATIAWQVTDTGIGIAATEHARLFEPFMQVPNPLRSDGTGLGLSITDHLVQLMNGEMRLVSEPGLGSSFTAILPVGTVDEGNGRAADASAPQLRAHPPVFVRTAHPELAESACEWLRRWGATAYRYNESMPPSDVVDAILLDSDPRDGTPLAWPGPRVTALASGTEQATVDPVHANGVIVTLFSIGAIANAVAQLQHGMPVSPPPAPACLPSALDLQVLVAEDNPINRVILKEQLESLGCTVVTAADGREALLQLNDHSFDVVLTDINMPQLDGLSLVRRLREAGAAVPVIGASANATPEDRARCLAAGMNGYLLKPINLCALRTVLTNLTAGIRA